MLLLIILWAVGTFTTIALFRVALPFTVKRLLPLLAIILVLPVFILVVPHFWLIHGMVPQPTAGTVPLDVFPDFTNNTLTGFDSLVDTRVFGGSSPTGVKLPLLVAALGLAALAWSIWRLCSDYITWLRKHQPQDRPAWVFQWFRNREVPPVVPVIYGAVCVALLSSSLFGTFFAFPIRPFTWIPGMEYTSGYFQPGSLFTYASQAKATREANMARAAVQSWPLEIQNSSPLPFSGKIRMVSLTDTIAGDDWAITEDWGAQVQRIVVGPTLAARLTPGSYAGFLRVHGVPAFFDVDLPFNNAHFNDNIMLTGNGRRVDGGDYAIPFVIKINNQIQQFRYVDQKGKWRDGGLNAGVIKLVPRLGSLKYPFNLNLQLISIDLPQSNPPR